MNGTEERLRAALQARADLYDDRAVAPTLPEATVVDRWRRPVVVAAVAATVAVAASLVIAFTVGDDADEVEPAPTPQTSDSARAVEDDETLQGDVDGDGAPDDVRMEGRVLTVELADTDGVVLTERFPRGFALDGLADVGADRQVIVVGGAIRKVTDDRTLAQVFVGGGRILDVWIGDGGELLAGTAHTVDGREYLTAYTWTGKGRDLTPSAAPMYCRDAAGETPRMCGSDATFVGQVEDLPDVQPAPFDTVGPGQDEVTAALPGWQGTTARLEGSGAGEVADGDVELVVGDARIAIPAGAGPRLINAAFAAGDGVAFALYRRIGDSVAYELYRYDGGGLAAVEVVPVSGLDLQGGGAPAGGRYVEVFLGSSGDFFTLDSASGIDLFQRAVQWRFDGSRLVGDDLGMVCLDSLVNALDVPGAYGRCSFD